MFRSTAGRTLAGCVALACLLSWLDSPARALARPFNSPTDRVVQIRPERVLYAGLIEGAKDTPVRDVDRNSFVIREDGTTREVLSVAPAKSPMAIAVLVDNSQAASQAIADLRRALTNFIAGIEGVGPVTIVTVADRPTIVVDYTTSQKDLQNGVSRLFSVPSSGATLLEAISQVAKGLAKREEERAAIVVVTTENIEFSQLHYRDVLAAVRDSGAALHAVVLTNSRASMNSEEARSRSTVLDRGPRESGGIRRDVLTAMAFDTRLIAMAGILKNQYRVTYARPESLIPPEKIEVTAAKPGLEAYGTPARGQKTK